MTVEGPVFAAPEGGDVAVKTGPTDAGCEVPFGVKLASVLVGGFDELP